MPVDTDTVDAARATTLDHLRRVLAAHWVMTLATHDPKQPALPYPTPLFFAVVRREDYGGCPGAALVFSSDPKSTHGQHLRAGPTPAAAAVYVEREEVDALRGAQLRGTVWRGDTLDARAPGVRAALLRDYLDRHPVARSAFAKERPPSLYLFEVTWAKVTDNRLGFGQHPVWSDNAAAWSTLTVREATDGERAQ